MQDLPVPAGRWFDWCNIFSSGWPQVGWLQDRLRPLSLVSASSRPPRLYQFQLAAGLTGARFSAPAGRRLAGCKIGLTGVSFIGASGPLVTSALIRVFNSGGPPSVFEFAEVNLPAARFVARAFTQVFDSNVFVGCSGSRVLYQSL